MVLSRRLVFLTSMFVALLAPQCATLLAAEKPTTAPVRFSADIAPVLLSRCQGCHGAEKIKGGYRLDTFDRMLTAGESDDPAVTPGKPDRSELYKLLVADA